MGVRRYSTRELSRNLGLCVETIRRAIRRGELQAYLGGYGRYQVVDEPALEMWLASDKAKSVLAHALSHYRRRHNAACQPTPSDPATNDDDSNKPK